MQIQLFNETKEKIPKGVTEQIEKALTKRFKNLKNSSISLIVKSKNSITKLNIKLFKCKYPTDVIAVNINELQAMSNEPTTHSPQLTPHLGELYICPSTIHSNAKKHKVDYNEELARVIIHGVLHLLGYDHKKAFGESKEKMFKLQETILRKINTT